MEIKIKKLDQRAVIPCYAHAGEDACFDLTAISVETILSGTFLKYHTGLAFEIPTGYVGLVFPRSSIWKYQVSLTNCVGVIDSGYRGEVTGVFRALSKSWNDVYRTGDRVMQMMIIPVPQIEFVETDKLSESSRMEGGYGSTGK